MDIQLISTTDKLTVVLDAVYKLIEANQIRNMNGCHLAVIIETYIKSAIDDLQKEDVDKNESDESNN